MSHVARPEPVVLDTDGVEGGFLGNWSPVIVILRIFLHFPKDVEPWTLGCISKSPTRHTRS